MTPESTEKSPSPIYSELEAMKIVGEALENLPDPAARVRVLSWLGSRFGVRHFDWIGNDRSTLSDVKTHVDVMQEELPGIARVTANGSLEITVRDLKARSTIDAALRLAHIVIYANEKLKGERAVSSRKILTPILKEWRTYDGNTRPALARHKGIHRDGDLLSLDAIAKKEAEKYIAEVLDESVQGTWNPNRRPNRKRPVKGNVPTQEPIA